MNSAVPNFKSEETDIEDSIVRFVREMANKKFYGDVTFKFQAGAIKHVAINQSVDMTGFMVLTIK